MNNRKLIRIAAAAFAALLAVLATGERLAAQESVLRPRQTNYTVIDLGTLGGPHSQFNGESRVLNPKGVAVGGASTPILDPECLFDPPYCFIFHAFRYQNHVMTDLGALPDGANSFAAAINSTGSIVGLADVFDPLIGQRTDAALWEDGQISDLGTLGGPFAVANDINNRGQVVGGGLNTIFDPFSLLGGTTQTRALLWHEGTMKDLGTLGGDDAFAILVNERGQVAGYSYTNSIPNPQTGIPTLAPFMWCDNHIVNIGTLGGVLGTANGLNNRGQVVGSSHLAGDQITHPFLWERGTLRDLGTFGGNYGNAHWIDDSGAVVGGATTENEALLRAFRWANGRMTNLGSLNDDPCSDAYSSNSRGQVVGNSLSDCDHDVHAFLWENGGPMVDLNSFVPPGSGIVLREVSFINERGEIAVTGHVANGDDHAFLLVPIDDRDENSFDAAQAGTALDQASPALIHTQVTPEEVSKFAARSAHRNRSLGPNPRK
jgi:probable HAF family extracellular repeat protein